MKRCGSALALLIVLLSSAAATQHRAFAADAVCSKPLVFGHRGGRVWAPENTLVAFKKTIDVGADGIELDVHKCASGELVVIHDETVDRTTNGHGAVKELTLAQLKQLDAGSWFGKEFSGERIPTLAEVLNLVNGKIWINVEIKNTPVQYKGIAEDLVELLKKYPHQDKIAISSFDHKVLRRVHEIAPQYPLGLLGDSVVNDMAGYAKEIGASSWNPGYDAVRADVIADAHAAHLVVSVWTPNKPEQWEALMKLGVDSIITDDPAGLMGFMESRARERHAALNEPHAAALH